MMENELVSVIMPAYRCRETLLRAVQSVQQQTYGYWQLLVVDDACPDASWKTIQMLADHDDRIRILHHAVNRGVAAARNTALDAAQGRYIAFLDSDDYWLPEKLSRQIDVLKKGTAIVFSDYWREKNGRLSRVYAPIQVDYSMLLRSNYIGNLTGIYDTYKLNKVYQKAIGHEDYLMWLQLLQQAQQAVCIQEPLAVYCVGSQSISGNKIKAARWQWEIYRSELELNVFQAAYCYVYYLINALLKRK